MRLEEAVGGWWRGKNRQAAEFPESDVLGKELTQVTTGNIQMGSIASACTCRLVEIGSKRGRVIGW